MFNLPTLILIAAALIGSVIALRDWRKGMLAALVVGFIQDPLRKIAPDQPLWFLGGVLVVAVAIFISAFNTDLHRLRKSFLQHFPRLVFPLSLLMLVVSFQTFNGFLVTGHPLAIALGILSYIMPLMFLLLGFGFSADPDRLARYAAVYIVFVVIWSAGALLENWGISHPLLDVVGTELYIYDQRGEVALRSGLFRAPEVAAIHAVLALSLLLVLGEHYRIWLRKDLLMLAIIVAVVLLVAIALAGRRKSLLQIIFFVGLYAFLRMKTGRRAKMNWRGRQLAGYLFVAGLALAAFMAYQSLLPEAEISSRYTEVQEYGFLERLVLVPIGSIISAIENVGVIGIGAGLLGQGGSAVLTPGASYAAGAASANHWYAEFGLGRIAAELGVIGLLVVIAVGFAFARSLFDQLRRVELHAPTELPLYCGLLAIMTAQIPSFVAAAQVYSDPFLLIHLGILGGGLCAGSTWADRRLQASGLPPGYHPHRHRHAAVPHTRAGTR